MAAGLVQFAAQAGDLLGSGRRGLIPGFVHRVRIGLILGSGILDGTGDGIGRVGRLCALLCRAFRNGPLVAPVIDCPGSAQQEADHGRIYNESGHCSPRGHSTSNTSRQTHGLETASSPTTQGVISQYQGGTSCVSAMPAAADAAGSAAQIIASR